MASLDQRLAALTSMPSDALAALWQQLAKSPPPRVSDGLLRQMIGHRLQARALGGLSAARIRALQAVADGRSALPALKPGTRLVRHWQGRTIAVLVGEEGYLFEDQRYRSLSEIARAVTGARWSGPRFFGLTTRG